MCYHIRISFATMADGSSVIHRREEMTFTDEWRDLRFHLERSSVMREGEVCTFFVPSEHMRDTERLSFRKLAQQVQPGLAVSDPLGYLVDISVVANYIAQERFFQNPERMANLRDERHMRQRTLHLQRRQQGGAPPPELRNDATEFVLAMQTVPDCIHEDRMSDMDQGVAGWMFVLIFQPVDLDEEKRVIEGGGMDEDMLQMMEMDDDGDAPGGRNHKLRRCHPRNSMRGVFGVLNHIDSVLGPRMSGSGLLMRGRYPAHVRESVLRLFRDKAKVRRAFTSYLLQAGISHGIRLGYEVGDATTLLCTRNMAAKYNCHTRWLEELNRCSLALCSPPLAGENARGPTKRAFARVLNLVGTGNLVVFRPDRITQHDIMDNYLEDSVPVPPLTDQQRAFIRMIDPRADIGSMSDDELAVYCRLVHDDRFDEGNIARFVSSLRRIYDPLLASVTPIDGLHVYEIFGSDAFADDRVRYIEFVRSRRRTVREITGRIGMYMQQPDNNRVSATVAALRGFGVERQTTGSFPVTTVKATPYTSAFQDQVHSMFSLLQMSCRLYKGFEIVVQSLLHAACVFFCSQDGMVLWNMTLHDTEGDSGKSWKMRLIRDLLLAGTWDEIGSLSSQALNYSGSTLMYCLVIIDELPRGLFEMNFGTNRETQSESEMSNSFKAILSAGHTKRVIVRSGDDGPKHETLTAEAFLQYIGGTNLPKGSYSSAMASRGVCHEMSDHQMRDTSAVTKQGIVEDSLVQGKGRALLESIVHRHQFLAMQVGLCEMPNAITMNTVVYDVVIREFQKRLGVRFDDRDLIGRGLSSAKMARVLSMGVQLFDTPLSPFNITPENTPDYFSKGYSVNDMHKLQACCGALTLEDAAFGISNIALKLKPKHEREIRLLVQALFSDLLVLYKGAQESVSAAASLVATLAKCAPYLSSGHSSGVAQDVDYVFVEMDATQGMSQWKADHTDTANTVTGVLMGESESPVGSSGESGSGFGSSSFRGIRRGVLPSADSARRFENGGDWTISSSSSSSSSLGATSFDRQRSAPVDDVRNARERERASHQRIALAMTRALPTGAFREGDTQAFARSIRSMTAETTGVLDSDGVRVKKPIMKTQAGRNGSTKVCFLVEHLMRTVTDDPISTLADILSELISVPERTFTVFGSEQRRQHPHLPRTLKVVRKPPHERTLRIPASVISRSAMNPHVAANVAAMMECARESNGDLSEWRRYNKIFHTRRVLNQHAVPVLEDSILPEGMDIDELAWSVHMIEQGITKDVLDDWGMRIEVCNPRLFDSYYRQLKVAKVELVRKSARSGTQTSRARIRVGGTDLTLGVKNLRVQSAWAGPLEYPSCFMSSTHSTASRRARRNARKTAKAAQKDHDDGDGDVSDSEVAIATWTRDHADMRKKHARRRRRRGKEEVDEDEDDDDDDSDMSDVESGDSPGTRHSLGLRELFGAARGVFQISTKEVVEPVAQRVRERIDVGVSEDEEEQGGEDDGDFRNLFGPDESVPSSPAPQADSRKRARPSDFVDDEAEEGEPEEGDDGAAFVDDDWGIAEMDDVDAPRRSSSSAAVARSKRRRVVVPSVGDDVDDVFGDI